MRRTLQWVGLWIVICLIPVSLLSTGISAYRRETSRLERERLLGNLERWAARRIQRSGDTAAVLRRELERLGRTAFASRAEPDSEVLRKGMEALARRFPCRFRWYPLDARGAPIPGLTEDGVGAGILRRLYQITKALREDPAKRESQFNLYWPMLSSFLGRDARPDLLPGRLGRGTFGPADPGPERAWFFGFVADGGALFVHLDDHPDFALAGMKDCLGRLTGRLRKHGWQAGLQKYQGQPTDDPDLNLALGEFLVSGNRTRAGERWIIHLEALPQGGLLWVKVPAAILPSVSDKTLDVGFFALLAVLALVCRFWSLSGRAGAVPIRPRLLSLFLIAVLLPLSALIGAGWDYLAQKERLLLAASSSLLERSLRDADHRFVSFTGDFGNRFNRGVDSHPPPSADDRARLDAWMGTIGSRYAVSHLELVNASGLPIHKIHVKDLTNRPEPLLRGLCVDILQRMNGNAQDARSTVGALWGNRRLPLESLGGVSIWNLLDQPTCMLFRPLRLPGQTTYSMVLFALWDFSDLAAIHLGKVLRQERRRIAGSYMGGTLLAGRLFAPPLPARGRAVLSPMIRSLLADLRSGKDLARIGLERELGYHAVAIHGTNILEASLVAVRNNGPVLREVRMWRAGLIGFSLLAIGFALYLTLLLSSQVLTPLGQLTTGVRALRDQDFNHRLPQGPADEFGELTRAFNHMLESLSDLEVGRVIQESFFPKGIVRGTGWRAIGRARSASHVGGDFFDIQPLPDGRLLVLIGRVKGPGVVPSLIMTMIKGIVEHEIGRGSNPETLLPLIREILSRNLPPFYGMTAGLGVIDARDPQEARATVILDGHPLPVLRRSTASAERQEPLSVLDFVMRPGDILYFFTEGWLDLPDASGMPLGRDRFVQVLAESGATELEVIPDHLFHRLETTCGNIKQKDDLTLLIIRTEEHPA